MRTGAIWISSGALALAVACGEGGAPSGGAGGGATGGRGSGAAGVGAAVASGGRTGTGGSAAGGGGNAAGAGASAGGAGGSAAGGGNPGGAGTPGNARVVPASNARAPGAGDQDDMAFWIHPTDKSQSTLISSDKASGRLVVYDNAGRPLQTLIAPGKPGNIDVRYAIALGGGKADLVGFNDRGTGQVAVFKVDAATRTIARVDDAAIVTAPANYGFCFYKSKTGQLYGFVTFEVPGTGRLQQYRLDDDGTGKIKGTKVREWTFMTSTFGEACVADDESGILYYADEPNGIYAVGAEPNDPTPGALVARTGQNGLTADVEGLAIYKTAGGGGYLMASSQGSNSYSVYDRIAPNALRATFTVQGATHTDGIDVTNVDIGGSFTKGCFVAHGGDDAASNFMTRWEDIAVPLGLTIDTAYDPRK